MNNQYIRLQKYLARCGIASRRASEKLMQEGRISVNDKIVTKMGFKILPDIDVVKFDNKKLHLKTCDVTLVLNKPAGYVSTMKDPQNRPCIASLVPVDKYPSLFPVGRLDRLTKGLLVFTTDGDLGQTLLHPKHEIAKKYEVIIDGKLTKNSSSYKLLVDGIKIKSGITKPSKITILEYFDFPEYIEYENDFFIYSAKKSDQDSLPSEKDLINNVFTRLEIEIHEGKNRQVRRMFDAVGYKVLLLTRKSIGNLKIGSLDCGKWRKLIDSEINLMLQRGVN